jgi:hypothetical protein
MDELTRIWNYHVALPFVCLVDLRGMVISAAGVFLPLFLAVTALGFAGMLAARVAAVVRLCLTWTRCSEGTSEVRVSEREAEDDTGGIPGRDKVEAGEDTTGSPGASKTT